MRTVFFTVTPSSVDSGSQYSPLECAVCTVYPKKYAHGFCFAVLCCGYTLTDFPISIRLTSLALWQSNDCPSASKATLMNLDKYFMWIHYERLHNHNKAKHNKTVCIFLGIYCRFTNYIINICYKIPSRVTWRSKGLSLAIEETFLFCMIHVHKEQIHGNINIGRQSQKNMKVKYVYISIFRIESKHLLCKIWFITHISENLYPLYEYWITNTKQACMGGDAICVPYLILLLPSGFDLITEPEFLIGFGQGPTQWVTGLLYQLIGR